jgi:hypothetical protein
MVYLPQMIPDLTEISPRINSMMRVLKSKISSSATFFREDQQEEISRLLSLIPRLVEIILDYCGRNVDKYTIKI